MPIEHRIHFLWLSKDGQDTYPDKYIPYINSWREHNPTAVITVWLTSDLHKFVRQYFPNVYNLLFHQIKPLICTCDILRFMLVYVFGGLYVDMDFYCERSFDDVFNKLDLFLIKDPFGPTYKLFNGIFGAHMKHPFIQGWVNTLIAKFQRVPVIHASTVLKVSGPDAFHTYYIEHYPGVPIQPYANFAPPKKKSTNGQYSWTKWNDGSLWQWEGSKEWICSLILGALLLILLILLYKYYY
jgi:mannosyltransferase OCH1-like enzyme